MFQIRNNSELVNLDICGTKTWDFGYEKLILHTQPVFGYDDAFTCIPIRRPNMYTSITVYKSIGILSLVKN